MVSLAAVLVAGAAVLAAGTGPAEPKAAAGTAPAPTAGSAGRASAGSAGAAGRAAAGRTKPRPPRPAPHAASTQAGGAVPAAGGIGAGGAGTLAAATAFGPGGVTAAWVQQENAKPGTRDWAITQPAAGAQIAGYASRVSVDVGDSVDLYVSTPAPSYRVDAYRMGWYGGDQARLVWSSPTVAGTVQPYCGVDPSLRMVSCNWNDPFTVATAAASWPQGDYLFKLTSSAGFQSYVPLTVRDDASRSAYLVNNDVTSWQAYNLWGDYDFYQGPTPSGGASLALRSYALSFDRPYLFSDGDGQGSSDFIGLELPMVTMMESLGLDVSYTTDIDFSENPAILEQHRSFITLGHDEYYSLAMRNGVIAARDQGVNLVFLGANAIYRHIRLQSSALGPDRVEVDYKDPSLDPLYGTDNADVTPWAWRDPPNNLPESVILGGMWQCNPVDADMVITSAGNWMFAGTGLVDGSLIPGIVGPEFDHYSPSQPSPLDVTVVAASPVTCDGQAEEADMTYYTAPSGAGVWDTGTIDWVGSLHPGCPGCPDPGVVTAITANVLAAFGRGPAGRVVPVTAN